MYKNRVENDIGNFFLKFPALFLSYKQEKSEEIWAGKIIKMYGYLKFSHFGGPNLQNKREKEFQNILCHLC